MCFDIYSVYVLWIHRFCPEVYYPFDSSVIDKYVVRDDYTPVWKVKDTYYFSYT